MGKAPVKKPWPWPYFSQAELACRCGCGLMNMDPQFMEKVVQMRRRAGFAFIVTSASRCRAHNAKVSTASDSPHLTGRAIDIAVHRAQAHSLVELGVQHGMTGIGVKQHGDSRTRFIHLDDLTVQDGYPRPNVWSYP